MNLGQFGTSDSNFLSPEKTKKAHKKRNVISGCYLWRGGGMSWDLSCRLRRI
jgi:hypothetical protein